MKLVILGDICPIGRFKGITEADNLVIQKELLYLLKDSDIVIANLECPLINKECKPISKIGPILGAPIDTALWLREKLNVKFVNLANNHIRDYGNCGIQYTLSLLSEARVRYLGLGKKIKEAYTPLIVKDDNLKIGICSFADKEFNYSPDDYTTAIQDFYFLFPTLSYLKENVDHIVCLIHKGHYMYPYPSPENYKLAHTLIDMGVNTVIFQHSHRIGATEEYRGNFILYGQGNFMFDYGDRVPKGWNESLLIMLDFSNGKVKYTLFPVIQKPSEGLATIADSKNSARILSEVEKYSDVVSKGLDELNKQWEKYVQTRALQFSTLFLAGNNKIVVRLIERLKLNPLKFMSYKRKQLYRNLLSSLDNKEILESIFNSD